MPQFPQIISEERCFDGAYRKYKHHSTTLDCDMNISVYLPPQSTSGDDVPALIFLSGLTCNEDNFITKAGAIKHASRLGLALICPDTSPRGVDVAGQDDGWDLGTGAGFYVDATTTPWNKHYKMYSYVMKDLFEFMQVLPVDPERIGIFGHSMGGHGALICALKNPGAFKSVSAFSPICHPTACAWGKKAFTHYLGDQTEQWKAYDATHLVAGYKGPDLSILIDQGASDSFLTDGQLLPEHFVQEAEKNDSIEVMLRMRAGYGHSYWFIQTFVEAHVEHHARYLNAQETKHPIVDVVTTDAEQ